MTYKKILNRVTVAFIALLVFLIIFSNTLATLSAKRVVLEFASRGIITTVDADGTAHTTNHPNVIPLSALHRDGNGHFILYAESVPKRFGSSYHARILRVDVGRRNDTHAAVTPIMGQDMPAYGIITASNEPVFSGERVRIVE
ncbi:MAG: hypothetical protein FWE90_00235 [Defluviitaleaceae bacterium]|nr:hypothetical protein [Defluviitaleaceae bacterium]